MAYSRALVSLLYFFASTWKKRTEHPHVGDVSIRSRNGAPSRKGCVVNGKMTKASNKRVPSPIPAPGARAPPLPFPSPPDPRLISSGVSHATAANSHKYCTKYERLLCGCCTMLCTQVWSSAMVRQEEAEQLRRGAAETKTLRRATAAAAPGKKHRVLTSL